MSEPKVKTAPKAKTATEKKNALEALKFYLELWAPRDQSLSNYIIETERLERVEESETEDLKGVEEFKEPELKEDRDGIFYRGLQERGAAGEDINGVK